MRSFVSRGGQKLEHAFSTFGPSQGLSAQGLRCADFGCSTGGFTDCLLQHGAVSVYAIDTGYGVLDYRLRIDERVRVMERTNALHAPSPPDGERPALVTIDMSWTPQRLCIPAALGWLMPDDGSRIVSLIKPHYEAKGLELDHLLEGGVLRPSDAERVMERVLETLPALGVRVLGVDRSPITGGKKKSGGNVEYLALLALG